jgi:hypothetical protein
MASTSILELRGLGNDHGGREAVDLDVVRGIADIAPNVAALLAFAAGFTFLGPWRFRFET